MNGLWKQTRATLSDIVESDLNINPTCVIHRRQNHFNVQNKYLQKNRVKGNGHVWLLVEAAIVQPYE